MEINRIHEVSTETEQRLLNHGLVLLLDFDTTNEYRHVKCDDELLFCEVRTSGDEVIERGTILVSQIETEINEKIDSIIEYIDGADKYSITLMLDFTDSFLRENNNPTQYIIGEIEKQFGFKPAIGTIQINNPLCRYKINMLVSSIKSFSALRQTSNPKLNYFIKIKENLGELLEANYFETPNSKEEVLDLLASNSSYDRWSLLMINALMMLLFEYVDKAVFIQASPLVKNLKPVAYAPT